MTTPPMSSSLNTTLSIIDSASRVLDSESAKKVKSAAATAAGTYQRLNTAGGAITAFSAQTTILSRAFIDESILDEPILANLMRSTHEWYAAQIIAALHLSQMVDGMRTVQDVLSVVQTGHNTRERGVIGNIHARALGMESFLGNYLGDAALESDNPFTLVTQGDLDKIEDRAKKSEKELADLKGKQNDVSVRSVSTSDNRIGPMGELYEVKLSNPGKNGVSIVVPVFIQMQPSIIPADVAPRFIDMNVAPNRWQRWTQMRAGELTFWKDFLLHRDLIRRQKSIIKDPKRAAAFSDFLKTVAKKDKYALDDATDRVGSRQSSNLANSVVVFSEDTIAQAKADSGIDLHNERDRQRYFRDTYSMIIMIIDPLHQRVTVYFNGLDGEINSSYADFRPKDAKFDPKDFMAALQAFSTNNIGRLR